MSILTWIEDKKRLKLLNAPKYVGTSTDSSKGLWTRCDKCGVILYIKHLKENQRVCFGCSYHLQMMSQERIENLLDRVPAISSLSSPSQGIERGVESTASSPASFTTSVRAMVTPKVSPSVSPSISPSVTPKVTPSVSPSVPPSVSPSVSPTVLREKAQKEEPKTTRGKALKKPGLDIGSSLRPGSARLSSRESMISTWRPLDETLSPCDPLRFHDQKAYRDRLQDAQERTGLQDAIQTGTGMIDGIPVALAVMDFSFMGGSMGSVVGEKITRLIEYATGEGVTLLIISASGGARMQEGVFSLMQMAKISSALQIYQSCARLLYISILTSPTTGGVTASFAMLGDIIFAEPKALIAFAGRRVIEQTLREDLPEDFQTSEYMLHHGLVDLIVPRRFLRQALSESIRLYQGAPFKRKGRLSFGVQNSITFLTEERVRREWGRLTKAGTKEFYSHLFAFPRDVKGDALLVATPEVSSPFAEGDVMPLANPYKSKRGDARDAMHTAYITSPSAKGEDSAFTGGDAKRKGDASGVSGFAKGITSPSAKGEDALLLSPKVMRYAQPKGESITNLTIHEPLGPPPDYKSKRGDALSSSPKANPVKEVMRKSSATDLYPSYKSDRVHFTFRQRRRDAFGESGDGPICKEVRASGVYADREVSARGKREGCTNRALQGRERDGLVENSRFSSDFSTEMYREILTSFEVMLPLLLSSNSDEQNKMRG